MIFKALLPIAALAALGAAGSANALTITVEPGMLDAEITSEESDEPRKFYVDGGTVEIIGHLVYDLDADGKKRARVSAAQLAEETGLPAALPEFLTLARHYTQLPV